MLHFLGEVGYSEKVTIEDPSTLDWLMLFRAQNVGVQLRSLLHKVTDNRLPTMLACALFEITTESLNFGL